jgi:hypothetical protein
MFQADLSVGMLVGIIKKMRRKTLVVSVDYNLCPIPPLGTTIRLLDASDPLACALAFVKTMFLIGRGQPPLCLSLKFPGCGNLAGGINARPGATRPSRI